MSKASLEGATTLLDPSGALIGTWLARHAKNEKPDAEALAAMMDAAAERIAAFGGLVEAVLIMRDGRIFEGETFELYDSAFLGPTSVIEYRMGQNPQVREDSNPAPVPGAYLVRDENTMFICAMAPRKAHDLPFSPR